MINILSQYVDEKEGTLTIHLQPQSIREGIVKLTPGQVEALLTERGIKRGECISGAFTVCNKTTFPDDYVLVYRLPQPKKKVEKTLDKSPKPVTLKKTTTHRKKTGG